MKTSDKITAITAALLKVQKEITPVTKNAKNPHFNSTFADLSAVIDVARPQLNSNGILFIQSASPSEDGRLHLTTRLIHESGEWIEDTAVTPLSKADPQAFGSAMTYLRRYSLSAMLGLYQEDDDGESATNRPASKPAKAASSPVKTIYKPEGPMATPDTLKALETLCFDSAQKARLEKVLDDKGIVAFWELSEKDASALLKWATSAKK